MTSRERAASGRLPTGTVTFVLTDIAGSTRFWEAEPAAMTTAVTRHYEIIDEVVDRHGGIRPLEQGEGDSTVSAFDSAAAALGAALDLQRILTAEPWTVSEPLRVRVAVLTGDAQLRGETAYVGPAITRAARLRSLGHGGQTLVSQSTATVAADELPDAAWLQDLGEHRLRDLSRPEQVFQLCHPDLLEAFPPLASTGSGAVELPVALTRFVGRSVELDEMAGALERDRLVTMTGSGGSGKTRLALEVARRTASRHGDGVRWCDLSALTDPELVSATIASSLGIPDVATGDTTDVICRHLADRRLLMVLDNCEHLAGACAALVEALLVRCGGLTILTTSREPLGAVGETTWHVPSLGVPPVDDVRAASDAVELFADRANMHRASFRLDDDNIGDVAMICRRLDGIPLAIELAASRVRTLTPAQILAGLSESFRMLTGGARTALPRQRTLEASIEWSHELLSDDERTLFRRLSVFAGGFTLDAAERVGGDELLPRAAVLDVLSHLVDRSLVQADDGGRGTRYRMLETIRDYARHKLNDAGESPSLRDRHLDYFGRLAVLAELQLETSVMVDWADLLDLELDNIRAALEWALDHGRSDDALRVVGALLPFWFARHLTEGRVRAGTALALDSGAPAARLKALVVEAATTTWSFVNPRRARELAEQAHRAASELGDKRSLARSQELLAFLAAFDDVSAGRSMFESAIALADESGDRWFSYLGQIHIGFLEVMSGSCGAAREATRSALAVARSTGNPLDIIESLAWSGFVALLTGELRGAERFLVEATEMARGARHAFYLPKCLEFSGMIALSAGRYAEAQERFAEELEIGRELEIVGTATAPALFWLAELAYAQDDPDAAGSSAASALALFESMDFKWGLAMSYNLVAGLACARGEIADARESADRSLGIARAAGLRREHGHALETLARLALLEGAHTRAQDLEHEALRLYVEGGLGLDIVVALEAIALMAADAESVEEATRLLAAADSRRAAIGFARYPRDRQGHDDLRSALQSVLQDRFELVWAEGAALRLDEAVAYATRARGERGRPSHGWDSLTPTEVQVVRLVREGLTNPQIGERLFIATGTVRSHLSHVFAKLGVTTRAELAGEAARRGV